MADSASAVGVAAVYSKYIAKMEVYREVQIGTQDKLDQLNVLRQNPHFAEFIDQCHETSNVSNPARKKTLEEVLMTPLFYLAQVQTCLTSIKAHSDQADQNRFDEVLAQFQRLDCSIQEEVNKQAMERQVLSLAARVEGASVDLTTIGRTLIEQMQVKALETGLFEDS